MRVVRKVLASSYEGEDLLVLAIKLRESSAKGVATVICLVRESFVQGWLPNRKLQL